MSGGANKDLLANPIGWLSKNVLVVAVNPTTGKAATAVSYTSSMVDGGANDIVGTSAIDTSGTILKGQVIAANITRSQGTARNANGKSIPVWEVKRGPALPSKHSHQFSAYFLPWRQNGERKMHLNVPNVTWFFTDTMNGCSFAAAPGPTPRVGHFNYQTSGENMVIDAAKISTQIAAAFPLGTRKRLDKAAYMDQHGMVRITTLGIKTGNTWNFYYQVREIVSLIPEAWTLPVGQPIVCP